MKIGDQVVMDFGERGVVFTIKKIVDKATSPTDRLDTWFEFEKGGGAWAAHCTLVAEKLKQIEAAIVELSNEWNKINKQVK